VGDADRTIAAYFASCHTSEARSVLLDVTLGTWGTDSTQDHVTFACEYRPEGAMARDAPLTLTESAPLLGEMLTREAALSHPWVDRFWHVADTIVRRDSLVHETLAEPP
jgi:hypothetical protein